MNTPSSARATAPSWLRYAARRMLLERHAEQWLRAVEPLWSLKQTRARVTAVIQETADVKTFVLRPNRRWPGHHAGQYTSVEVEIDGVRVRRCYSLSSAPTDPSPAITVKRVPDGRVSRWLHDRIQPGDVLGLGEPMGDFVLSTRNSAPLLFYSGGSGITPVMAMLRDLDRRQAVRDVVFVHHARSQRDVIFAEELRRLTERHRGALQVHLRLSDTLGDAPRFDPIWLASVVPDFAQRSTYLCGPPGLMAAVDTTWSDAGVGHRLRRERFVPAPMAAPDGGQVQVTLARRGRKLAAEGGTTLLEALEASGQRPAYGCRMGICRTCACRKRRGTVRNLTTGAVSSEPDEEIRLCVTAPLTDIELDA